VVYSFYFVREDIPSRVEGDGNFIRHFALLFLLSERTSPLEGDGLFRKLGSWEAVKIGEKRVPALLISL
jgi:hypothetical protein